MSGCRTRKPNLFGYLSGAPGKKVPCPSSQLRAILKLQVKEYGILKTSIQRLAVKHMDVKLSGSEQRDKLDAIENALKEEFPEIFITEDSQKRLYFVVRMLLHDHACRRSCHKKQQQIGKLPPKVVKKEGSNCATHDRKHYPVVHGFLQASMPPMTHLMENFINFGCINEEYLRAISLWSFERIQGLLDQLPGPDGRQLTGMEKLVLQNHFKEYFVQPCTKEEKVRNLGIVTVIE